MSEIWVIDQQYYFLLTSMQKYLELGFAGYIMGQDFESANEFFPEADGNVRWRFHPVELVLDKRFFTKVSPSGSSGEITQEFFDFLKQSDLYEKLVAIFGHPDANPYKPIAASFGNRTEIMLTSSQYMLFKLLMF